MGSNVSAGDVMIQAIAEAVVERLEKIYGLKRVLDSPVAAEYLSISEDALSDVVAQKKIVPVRLTRKVQYDILDLDRLIRESKTYSRRSI